MKNTTLCYIERNNKYLMLHRTKKEIDLNKDKWIGIGGHFEKNESPEDCARREILEETGLHSGKLRFRGVITFISDTWETEYMFLFTGKNFVGEPTVCNEGELDWVNKSDIFTLQTWSGDKFFLEAIINDEDCFLMTLKYEGDNLVYAEKNGKKLI